MCRRLCQIYLCLAPPKKVDVQDLREDSKNYRLRHALSECQCRRLAHQLLA